MVRANHLCASIAALAFCCVTALSTASAAPASGPISNDVTAPVAGMTGLSIGFGEALVRTKPTSDDEDRALVQAVEGYRHHATLDDVRSLRTFAAAFPQSGWWLAVEVNLGLIDYHDGYYSRALEEFATAWSRGKTEVSETGHALADRAVGELLQMHAKLGHIAEVKALLTELDGKDGGAKRPLMGAGGVLRDQTISGLWIMEHRPGVGFLCGPAALTNLLASLGVPEARYAFVEQYQSGPHGVTLAQVSRLADEAKFPHRLIFREPGEPVPVPSIIHWKVNHFAAIVAEQNGLYEVKDPTFGPTQWIPRDAIDAEGSGYFLVPARGGTNHPEAAQQSRAVGQSLVAATAWRPVPAKEAEGVYGMGSSSGQDPNGTTPFTPKACSPCGSPGGRGMATYDFDEMNVSLRVQDTPVGYTPPVGPPVWFTISYVQLQPTYGTSSLPYSLGNQVTLNWQSFLVDSPTNPAATVTRAIGGGGGVLEAPTTSCSTLPCTYTPEVQDNSVLTLISTSPIKYQRTYPDGSSEIYAQSNGATNYPRLVFLTQVIDPAGNAVTLAYDSSMRLSTITDALGQQSTISYPNLSSTQISKITDPFGRYAQLYYTGSQLIQITDEIGLTSKFAYSTGTPNNMATLTTAYGKTIFTITSLAGATPPNGNILAATDPLGNTEMIENGQGLTEDTDPLGAPSGTEYKLENKYLSFRDTYYWNKYAYSQCSASLCQGSSDLALARNRHWAHFSLSPSVTSDTIESVRYALENRVWYDYPNQTSANSQGLGAAVRGTLNKPVDIARILDSGEQLFSRRYNALGNLTSSTDAVGRTTTLAYNANNIDVATVQQATSSGKTKTYATIARFGSYVYHEPQTYIDAAGQSTVYTYGSTYPYGQLTSSTDALGNTIVYQYYPTNAATGTRGQLQSITRNGAMLYTFTYDSHGCVQTLTDLRAVFNSQSDWSVTLAYDNLDRLTRETFLDGTSRCWQYRNLDVTNFSDRQQTHDANCDPSSSNSTQYVYDDNRNLVQIIDPAGHNTYLTYWPDGKLQSLEDPDGIPSNPTGHKTNWAIDVEERVTSKQMADGTTTSYSYDSAGRLSSIKDALGQIQVLNYDPDNELTQRIYEKAVNPTASVAYSYDPYYPRLIQTSGTNGTITEQFKYFPPGALGALMMSQEVEGTNGIVAYTYDAIGRISTRTVAGSAESWTYEPKTGQMRVQSHADGLGNFTLGYLDATNQLTSQSNGTVGTAWSYDTNANDRRLTNVATTSGTAYGLTTTTEDEITGIIDSWNGATITNAYDRLERFNGATGSGDGTYGNFGATNDPAGNLTSLTRPTSTVSMTPNVLNQIASANSKTFTYDADGDLLTDYGRTYKWDAANRMISIAMGSGNPSVTFSYDALGRRVKKTVTQPNGGGSATTSYLWCGQTLCMAQYGGGVTRRYVAEGEVYTSGGTTTPYYYGPDQLGSVRDVLNAATGAHMAHYDYDTYGLGTGVAYGTVTGTAMLTDYGYAGLLYESASGISLANYRAYDPQTARWMSRDPIGERGGINLYQYVAGNPESYSDPFGLCGTKPSSPKCQQRTMLVTAYASKGPGSDWPYYKPVNPGDPPSDVGPDTVAVANTNPPAYPYGTTFTVLNPDGSTAYTGVAHDTGAGWNPHHFNVDPSQWIDIWVSTKAAANNWGQQWRSVMICE